MEREKKDRNIEKELEKVALESGRCSIPLNQAYCPFIDGYCNQKTRIGCEPYLALQRRGR